VRDRFVPAPRPDHSVAVLLRVNSPAVARQRLLFIGRFLLLLGVFYVAVSNRFSDRVLVQPFTAGIAAVAGVLLRLFGYAVQRHGTLLTSSNFAVEIKTGCNGVEAMLVLVAAIVAYPAPWRRKAIGAAVGIAVIQLLNLARVLMLFIVGRDYPARFELFHVVIGQSVIFLASIAIFLVWSATLAASSVRESHG
jgi:exosortase H (IPTLxxWG-CTERM-specific)